jgi:predicted flap endonuclease-1-like 5' DNA nuclease
MYKLESIIARAVLTRVSESSATGAHDARTGVISPRRGVAQITTRPCPITCQRWPTREHEHMPDDDLPKIGAPATRALASIGVTQLADVADRSESELLRLDGFGPRALRILKEALAANDLSMRP